MLILPQMVETTWNNTQAKWFIEKGYPKLKQGTKFMVNVLDLKENSNVKIMFTCDYCGKEFLQAIFNSNKHKEYVDDDCCKECKNIKIAKIIQLKYGVSNVNKLQWVKDSKMQTYIVNYGVDNPMKNKEIQDKAKQTNNILYGGNSPSHNKEVRAKQIQTLYKNGTQKTSSQQIYLKNLLCGELNYPINKFSLDIAFPEKMIYIEYDGGGHNLGVKLGSLTQLEFNNKEIRRYCVLKSQGWKQIKIISPKDYLPSDNVLIDEYNKALEWFKSEEKYHSHYIINIGIETKNNKYGDLRKLKKGGNK